MDCHRDCPGPSRHNRGRNALRFKCSWTRGDATLTSVAFRSTTFQSTPLREGRPSSETRGAWTRVSSRPQELEGCSLATQGEGVRAGAAERGGIVKRMFKITETASKTDRRKNFKEMLAYCKANATDIDGILVYKVERAARNMSDYGRLLDLEVSHGILLIAVSQPTQDNPAGRMARNMMAAMSGSQQAQSRARCSDVQKQLDETRRQQERLLNLHLSGNLDEATFATKNTELRDRHATLKLELEVADRGAAENIDKALRVFELSQSLPEKWVKSDYTEKRRIIEMVCLDLILKGTSLCIATRKPFNALVEGFEITESGEGETRLELFFPRPRRRCRQFALSPRMSGGG